MNCPNTALMLYSPLAGQVDMLTWTVWALVVWNTLLTGLVLYIAFYAKHKVEDATCGFAAALQESLLSNRKEAVK
jgi:hypothetical protein